jgi:hypothetical protein
MFPADIAAPPDAPRLRILTQWSPAAAIAFRLAFTTAVLTLFHLIGFAPSYVYFDRARSTLDRWLGPVGAFEFQIMRAVGAAVMRVVTGSTATVEEIARRYSYPLCYLAAVVFIVAAATTIWSVLDHRRPAYPSLNRWLRLYARYALALVMLTYAVVKIVPTQFGYLTPGDLIRPLGQINRFWVLWNFMVVSTSYTVFTGLVELLGCVLLFFRRTSLLGALLLAGALVNVFAMDLAYDVLGAAMVAGTLIVLVTIVVGPYLAPLFRVLVRGAAERMPDEPTTALARWRYAPAVKVVLLVLLVSARVDDGLAQRRSYFGRGRAIYGVFDVASFSRAGVVVTPLANDAATWTRIASDGRYGAGGLSVQYANAAVRQFRLDDDAATQSWTLRDGSGTVATLHYVAAADGTLSLDGRIGGDEVRMHLRPVDMQTFPLVRGRPR